MDGKLDEPAWVKAEPATDLPSNLRMSARPTTERTEVRVPLRRAEPVHWSARLGFGAQAHQRARVEAGRDFTNDERSSPPRYNHDHRDAYRFAVNPLGTQQDALVTDEGERYQPLLERALALGRRASTDKG